MTTAIIFFIMGIAFLYTSFNYQEKIKRLADKGETLEGLVFDFETSSTAGSAQVYPVIRFVTKKDEWITLRSDIGVTPSYLMEGDKVTVIYNPDKPSEFMLNKASRFLPNLFIIVGIALLVGGICFLMNYLGYFSN